MELTQVLVELRPGANWNLSGETYAGLEWNDQVQSKPTEQEITDYIAANSYKEARKAKYPDWREFADAIYWNEKGDNTKLLEYIVACDQVKLDYPKP